MAFLVLLLPACAAPPAPLPSPVAATDASSHLTPSPPPAATPSVSPLPSTPALPSATPTPAGCHAQHGSDLDQQLELENGQTLAYRVHLPPCFSASGPALPLLVLLHGQSYDETQWERLGFSAAADALVGAGKNEPYVIVYPRERDTYADPFQSTYGEQLLTGLFPALEKDYNICSGRRCRAIGGLSRGASWAALLAINHPEEFAWVGGHSMAPFIGLEQLLRRSTAGKRLETLTWYLDTGHGDAYRKPLVSFEQTLTELNLPHEWHLNRGMHDETYWAGQVAAYAAWYGEKLGMNLPQPQR